MPALSALNLPVQGGTSTLSPSPGRGTHGPSWRMLVELGPEVHAWGTYPGGQSGNPASRWYLDRVPRWAWLVSWTRALSRLPVGSSGGSRVSQGLTVIGGAAMKRWLSFAVLVAAFALATRLGWWAVPIVAALWGVLRPTVNAPAGTAALAAASAWALWLLWDWQADHHAMEVLSTRLGGVMGVPPAVLILLTLLLGALLAWSAAALAGPVAEFPRPTLRRFPMINRFPLALAAACLAGGASLAAQNYDSVTVRTIPAGQGVYMLMGAGGNIALSVGDYPFLVDDEFAQLSQKILAAVRQVTDKPVRFLVNTHWHGDHTGGNENMANSRHRHRGARQRADPHEHRAVYRRLQSQGRAIAQGGAAGDHLR